MLALRHVREPVAHPVTRHLYHLVSNTRAVAAVRPLWAPENRQLHASEATALEAAKELYPERLRLGRSDAEADDR